MCSEIADLVTGYLDTIREVMDEAAKGDANSGLWLRTTLRKWLCVLTESVHLMHLFQNPTKGFSTGCPDSAPASCQPAG